MATYKVLQDIEAEDKLLGPLSLRQFIYAVIVVVLGFIMFKLATVQPLLALPFLPPAILFAVLAAPLGHDQSSEIWLLAKIRFALKPRQRVWDQSGLQELVKVTAPKQVEQVLTNGLSEGQVKSRLEALSQTIDTRGWVIKGVNSNLYTAPSFGQTSSDDRLLTPSFTAPANVDDTANDILDVQTNPLAQQMDQMVKANDQTHRQALLDKMDQIRSAQAAQPQPAATSAAPAALPPLPPLPATKMAYGQTAVLQPDSPDLPSQTAPAAPIQAAGPAAASAAQKQPVEPVTTPAKPVILKLASNDDLSVAAIARQANKPTNKNNDGEVVISLR
jgi:hypothetical protein